MNTRTLIWQALTPVHPGTGQTSASVIDLPVAREAATGYPVIPASSLKGVLRDGRDDATANAVFGKGPDPTATDEREKGGYAASLTLTDARVLCMPVRSYKGTFAMLTCPLVLHRLERDREALGLGGAFGTIPDATGTEALITENTALEYNAQLILEDIDLNAKRSPEAQRIGATIAGMAFPENERAVFLERFAIVSNDVFAFFSEIATEVIARVRLDPKEKTVSSGGLWYEEAIPAETLFSSFALSSTDDFTELGRAHVQVGGQGSVGRGLLRLRVSQ